MKENMHNEIEYVAINAVLPNSCSPVLFCVLIKFACQQFIKRDTIELQLF